MSHPTTNKDLKEGNRCTFNDSTEEWQLTSEMAAMKEAPVAHEENNQSIDLQHERRQEKEELEQELGLENAQDDYIEALMLNRFWYYHKLCKTATKVTTRRRI